MIIAVGSWRGTGATTTALLAAACSAAIDDHGAWLVEADPAGGVLAGRLEVAPRCIGGLEQIAFPSERISAVDAFEAVAHVAGGVSTITAPADPFRAFACHQPRMAWVAALRELPGTVVVDVGRLGAGTPVWPVLAQADVVLLVASPEVTAAVAAAEWLQAGGRVSPADAGLAEPKARIVVVESPCGVAFSRATLQAELGDRCAGWLPWEPGIADLVHRGAAAGDRRLRRSALIAAVNQVVLGLVSPTGAALDQGASR